MGAETQVAKRVQRGIFLLVILFAGILMSISVHADAATTKVKVYLTGQTKASYHKSVDLSYEGKSVYLGFSPVLSIDGCGMAPYTEVFVKRGPKMRHSFNQTTGTLILKYNGDTLKLQNKSKVAYFNGKKILLSRAPYYVKYATTKKRYFMVPIHKVSDLFGLNYEYSFVKNTVYLSSKSSTQASEFKNMSTTQIINVLGPLAQENARKTGIKASVILAQAILESGWGKSELALNANNLFGMKKSLSGNTWSGSAWDGKSVYAKRTAEYDGNNQAYYITAEFRKYKSIEDSIEDHSAYLLGAKNGSSLRYKGLASAPTYQEQLLIIQRGGYATSQTYAEMLCSLIQSKCLYKWD